MSSAANKDGERIAHRVRRRPVQARSAETFERILDAARELLAEVGWEGFNTNLVAERSGVSVRALYRYFPNKLAVVSVLAERSAEEWDAWFEDYDDVVLEGTDWPALWPHAIDRFVDGVRAMPAGVELRRAMAASPALREIDLADNLRLADRLASALRASSHDLTPRAAKASARTLIESAVASIDLALDSPPATSRALISELKAMHVAYLNALFE